MQNDVFSTIPEMKLAYQYGSSVAASGKEPRDIDPMICYQVLKKGKLVYGDSKKAKEFLVKTLTRYFDYLFLHQYFVDRMKSRLGVKNGG